MRPNSDVALVISKRKDYGPECLSFVKFGQLVDYGKVSLGLSFVN